MSKILTISIAAYNVAAFIKDTLESCVVPEIMDDIEVLIENDGSTDNTASIVEEFQKRYPNTYRLINKENGGYGTTVNRSIEEAKGKYFKLLDGDDWFDRNGLKRLVEFLKEHDTDWAVTRIVKVKDEVFEEIEDRPLWMSLCGETYNVKDIDDLELCYAIGMWQVTVKTSLLREHPFVLPEHTLYTDQLYIFYQLPYIKTITFLDFPVYRYRIGRDGQSASRESRIKHFREAISNLYTMLMWYDEHKLAENANRNLIIPRLTRYYMLGLRTFLLLKPSKNVKKEIICLEDYCKKHAHEVYKMVYKYEPKKYLLMRATHYNAYYFLAWRGIENWE